MAIPNAPSLMTAASAGPTSIDLTWQDNSADEVGFSIERSLNGADWSYLRSLDVNIELCTDTDGVVQGTTYYYRAYAYNAEGESARSNVAYATAGGSPPATPPSAPTTLVATAATPTRINLTWVDTSADESGFVIKRSLTSGGTYAEIASLAANIETYADLTCVAETTYYYKIYAFNSAGNSAEVGPASATTPYQSPLGAAIKASMYPHLKSWAVTYYEYGANTSVADEDARCFDLFMNPHDPAVLRASSPDGLIIIYECIDGLYEYGNDPGADALWNDINAWVTAHTAELGLTAAALLETLFVHSKYDMDVYDDNTPGQDPPTIFKVIPGWDAANDANANGTRDYASDWGRATSTGSGQLLDTTKTWTSNQWQNHKLVDSAGTVFTINSNDATRIYVTGTPATGRYGLSHATSVNHLSTAQTKIQSRLLHYGWPNTPVIMAVVFNQGGTNFRHCIGDILTTRFLANANNQGWMLDSYTAAGDLHLGKTLNGTREFIEGITDANYGAAYAATAIAIQAALNLAKTTRIAMVTPNTVSRQYPALWATGAIEGEHLEMWYSIESNILYADEVANKMDWLISQSAKGLYSWVLPIWDAGSNDPTSVIAQRNRMLVLSMFYIAQQEYTYLGFTGWGHYLIDSFPYNNWEWFDACEYDVGTPVDSQYVVAQTGNYTHPTYGQRPYTIYSRKYTKALMVSRPRFTYYDDSTADTTAVTYILPSYAAQGGGTSNEYKILFVDGTVSTSPVTQVVIRNSEGFVLIPTQAGGITPPPSGEGPTTVPNAPNNLLAFPVSSSQINLVWSDNSIYESGYKVERATSLLGTYTEVASLAAGVTNYSSTSLNAGTTYYYKVYAYNTYGNSTKAGPTSGTTQSAQPPPPGPISSVYEDVFTRRVAMEGTRAKIRQRDERALEDWEVERAVVQGYKRAVRLSKCLRSELLTCNTVLDQYTYELSSFGMVADSDAGKFIFQISDIWYDETHLLPLDWLIFQRQFNTWPFDSHSKPTYWTPYDDQTALVYPKPDTANIILSLLGYRLPNVDDWVGGAEPVFHSDFYDLIELHAAASLLVGTANDQSDLWRQSVYGQQFLTGIKDMRASQIQPTEGVPRLGTGRRRAWFGSERMAYETGEPIT